MPDNGLLSRLRTPLVERVSLLNLGDFYRGNQIKLACIDQRQPSSSLYAFSIHIIIFHYKAPDRLPCWVPLPLLLMVECALRMYFGQLGQVVGLRSPSSYVGIGSYCQQCRIQHRPLPYLTQGRM